VWSSQAQPKSAVKETKEQKQKRIAEQKQANEVAFKYVLPGVGAFFVLLFLLFVAVSFA